MGRSVLDLGPRHGTAALAKAINNGIGRCNMAALPGGVRTAAEQGMPVEDVVKVIVASSGRASVPAAGARPSLRPGHPLGEDVIEAMLAKDLHLAAELADESQVDAAMFHAAVESLPAMLRNFPTRPPA